MLKMSLIFAAYTIYDNVYLKNKKTRGKKKNIGYKYFNACVIISLQAYSKYK